MSVVREGGSGVDRPRPSGDAVTFFVTGVVLVLIGWGWVPLFGAGWWLTIVAGAAGVASLGWFAGFIVRPRWTGRQVRVWQCLSFRTHEVARDSALELVPVRVLRYSGYCAAVKVRSREGDRMLMILGSVCSDPTKASNMRLAHQRWRDAQVGDAGYLPGE